MDFFDVSEYMPYPDCEYDMFVGDFLDVFDGPSIESTKVTQNGVKVKHYCNINGPNGVVSTGNVIFLRFYTDLKDVSGGFSIYYKWI